LGLHGFWTRNGEPAAAFMSPVRPNAGQGKG